MIFNELYYFLFCLNYDFRVILLIFVIYHVHHFNHIKITVQTIFKFGQIKKSAKLNRFSPFVVFA